MKSEIFEQNRLDKYLPYLSEYFSKEVDIPFISVTLVSLELIFRPPPGLCLKMLSKLRSFSDRSS